MMRDDVHGVTGSSRRGHDRARTGAVVADPTLTKGFGPKHDEAQ